MTSPAHERASDRVAEACAGDDADIVVMVQGDEPMIRPGDDRGCRCAAARAIPTVSCVNLAAPIRSEARAAGPQHDQGGDDARRRGVVLLARADSDAGRPAIRGGTLVQAGLRDPVPPRAPCSGSRRCRGAARGAESIDMLRFLENGISVRIVPTDSRDACGGHARATWSSSRRCWRPSPCRWARR